MSDCRFYCTKLWRIFCTKCLRGLPWPLHTMTFKLTEPFNVQFTNADVPNDASPLLSTPRRPWQLTNQHAVVIGNETRHELIIICGSLQKTNQLTHQNISPGSRGIHPTSWLINSKSISFLRFLCKPSFYGFNATSVVRDQIPTFRKEFTGSSHGDEFLIIPRRFTLLFFNIWLRIRLRRTVPFDANFPIVLPDSCPVHWAHFKMSEKMQNKTASH